MIVGFAAGGGTDTYARIVAPKLSAALGQQDMNEAQVRTLDQVRVVVAGTQALEFRPGGDDAAAGARRASSRPTTPLETPSVAGIVS